METITVPAPMPANQLSYFDLNAMLNLYAEDHSLQLDRDKEATKQYFLQHVNQNTVFFHSLEEKLDYLVENKYYDPSVLSLYPFEFIKARFKQAYGYKFRFKSFIGAYKYYMMYTLKTFDGSRYLERYEDRVVMNALYLGHGDQGLAEALVDEIMSGRFQPATPTFLNAGKMQRGEMVSCFLLRVEDNLESIGRSVQSALQLSKRGGGVALCLTNLREAGAPIKGLAGRCAGPVPVMKLYEDSFTYADQLGQRQGAGAVYINVHHPDILSVLDTKRENADEKVRIKTLSIGLVIPDIAIKLAARKDDQTMYLFSPYDVERVYGIPMSDLSITEHYEALVANPEIRKKKINARELFQVIAELCTESGYPYFVYEDHVNRANPIAGRINMSNLCSEILQVNTPSTFHEDSSYDHVGRDISCNLGSLNIDQVIEHGAQLELTIERATRALTTVSDLSNIACVPSIAHGNGLSHAIGLGDMNLHGFFAKHGIAYDSEEAIDFTQAYYYTVNVYSLKASCLIAKERQQTFYGFEDSKYADGQYFELYRTRDFQPKTQKVKDLFAQYQIHVPTREDIAQLEQQIKTYGLYHAYRRAIAPTGSISYINHSTPSIMPVTGMIEIRKEGKLGRLYYPAPNLSNDNKHLFKSAYDIGPDAVIDLYAAATPHVDQGLSLTLFFPDTASTRDINRAQIYAWKKGIKTLYYVRIRQDAMEGTDVSSCVSCAV